MLASFPGLPHPPCRSNISLSDKCLGQESATLYSDKASSPTSYSNNDFQAFYRAKKNKTFIVKPESGCQGRGIFVFKNPKVTRMIPSCTACSVAVVQ